MSDTHTVTFVPSGRGKARCAPDPNFPNGKAVFLAPPNAPACTVVLPYPAPECGHCDIACNVCGYRLLVTAAGRPDDPTKITMPCRSKR